MASFKKCDICDTVIDEELIQGKVYIHDSKYSIYINNVTAQKGGEYDLCANCTIRLHRWLNDLKRRVNE